MSNMVILLYNSDVLIAERICGTLTDVRLMIFDHNLVDAIANSSLAAMELIVVHNYFPTEGLIDISHKDAAAVENALGDAVKSIIPNLSFDSWQHRTLYDMFLAINCYKKLYDDAHIDFSDTTPHVLICDNPAEYSFPCFIPALLLIQKLQKDGIQFKAYLYGKNRDRTAIVPDFSALGKRLETHDILAHTPTCFYDNDYFNEELAATGKSILSIPSKYAAWDTTFPAATTVGLTNVEKASAKFPKKVRKKVDSFYNAIHKRLDSLLTPHISSVVYRSIQSRHLSSQYKSQLVTFLLFDEYFEAQSMPSGILLTDHDTGFHGPILSYFKKKGVPVLFIPHSKIINGLEFDCGNAKCLTHPVQSKRIMDGNGAEVTSAKLKFAETRPGGPSFPPKAVDRIERIGLLLNPVCVKGIYVHNYADYIAGIARLVAWCGENKVGIGIRNRPGFTLLNLLSKETGIPVADFNHWLDMSMPEFAKSHDLCLMYGSQTTGAIDFLQRSIPILNPLPEDALETDKIIFSSELIPRGNVASIIKKLDSFRLDHAAFLDFGKAQSGRYYDLCRDALPLRHFIGYSGKRYIGVHDTAPIISLRRANARCTGAIQPSAPHPGE